jgi:hypothetical protein
MDTDHPVFQSPAPEYVDSVFDILRENVADRWKQIREISQRSALAIVDQEARKLFGRPPAEEAALAQGRHITAILAHIVDSATPLAQLDAVCYCYGMLGRSEESMDAIAKRHGISRQAFSKKVERTAREFGIAPRGGMRPERQRKIYTEVHRQKWDHINQDAPKSA